MCSSSFNVERVVNSFPQLQMTLISWYCGMRVGFHVDVPLACRPQWPAKNGARILAARRTAFNLSPAGQLIHKICG